MQQSTNSATDTRKGRLEDSRTEGMSKQAKSNEGVTQQHVHAQKRQSCDQDAEKSVKNANAETDRPQASESVHVPNKRAKNDTAAAVSVENEAGAQSPGQAEPAASAAPAAPVCGGFGGLASKGASGFAFGGNSTFGSGGFGSVAFGGNTFASSGMGANSFTTKASKDKQDDRGSPSVASNAGSVQQQHQQQQIGVFTSTADAGGAGPSNMPVFGTTNSAIEGGAREPLQPAAKPLTGEEDESTVWSSKAALYHFEKRGEKNSWRERGIGMLRVNVGPSGRARMVMRQLGNLKLLLNAAIFPDLKLERTEGMPRVSFCCANKASEAGTEAGQEAKPQKGTTSEGATADAPAGAEVSGGMGMYALKMGSNEKVVAFLEQVNRLKEGDGGEQGEVGGEQEEVDVVADKTKDAEDAVVAATAAAAERSAEQESAEQDEGVAAAAAAAAACAVDVV